MADDQSRAQEYRERAILLRRAVKEMDSVEGRQFFLHIADQFEQLADSIDRSRFH